MTTYKNCSLPQDNPVTTGILLVNLGTPDAPTTDAVRRYLDEFLWDNRVVEAPRWLWWLALHGVILRIRPKRVAKVYQSVWRKEGSPLLHYTQALTEAVSKQHSAPLSIRYAMRYGNPSIATVLAQLQQQNLQRLLVIPLFPQYSATTSAAVFDEVTRELQSWRYVPEIRFCMQYHDHPKYISGLAASIRSSFQQHGTPQQLLFSFHGIPQRYCDLGDPYSEQCHTTARLVAAALKLDKSQWQLTFQSRFGREPWLQPYTDHTLKALPAQGITSVQIISPGFAVDCIETLEELAIQNREFFQHAGGKEFHYIPALNNGNENVALMTALINEHTMGWTSPHPDSLPQGEGSDPLRRG